MLESYLVEEQLAARWCVLLGVVYTAAFYILMLLDESPRLALCTLSISQKLLSITASSILSSHQGGGQGMHRGPTSNMSM